MNPELESYLKEHKINYKMHLHQAVFTVAESSKIVKDIPGIRTKSLFLKDEKNNFYLICLAGEKRLNTKALKNILNIKSLEFASPEELKSELNRTSGSVSPFAILNSRNTNLIIDSEVWNSPIIQSHPDVNTETLELSHEDLKKFYDSLKCKKSILLIPEKDE